MTQLRAIGQRSREKKQKQQSLNLTENILLKGCTKNGVRNYGQKSSDRPGSGAAWNTLHSRRFLTYQVFSQKTSPQSLSAHTCKGRVMWKTPVRERFWYNSLAEGPLQSAASYTISMTLCEYEFHPTFSGNGSQMSTSSRKPSVQRHPPQDCLGKTLQSVRHSMQCHC
ncbi:hypothetical protein TNCV_4865141 [Trichonephila clavipes]|nr:hypothetical protein TNCV_4865141 [Trichonephila clavipes]